MLEFYGKSTWEIGSEVKRIDLKFFEISPVLLRLTLDIRMVTSNKLEEHNTHRIHITLSGGIIVFFRQFLNWHVRQSSLPNISVLNALVENRKTKISKLIKPIFNQNIFQLEVLMKNFGIPENPVPIHQLVEDIEDLLLRKGILLLLA